MEKLERPEDSPRAIKLQFSEALASGNDVLDVRGLSMAYGERALFEDISFLLKRGDRALIIGPNGCGKSTLIKLILGRLAPTGGVIEEGYNVEIGYYDQENQNLTPENTVLEQAAYNRSQKDVPSAFWTPMASLITPLLTAKAEGKTVTDEQLMGYLEALCKQIRKG